MRERSLLYPLGYWSPETHAHVAEPTGWPTSVGNASDWVGHAAEACGPMTVDQAMEFFWRIEQSSIQVEVAVPTLSIASSTSATALRYDAEPPSASSITNGNERNLITDLSGAFAATQPIKGWYYATYGPDGNGISWTFKLIAEFIWLNRITDTAFIAIRMSLDWVKASSPEFTFLATEQSDWQLGALDIGPSQMDIYGNEQDDAYSIDVVMTPTLWYERKKSTNIHPIRSAGSGAYVTGVTYPVRNLDDIEITA